MAVKTRIAAIDKDLTVLFPDTFGPAERSKALAQYATTAKNEADAQNRAVLGRVPPSESYVDGRQGARFDSVRPDGVIVVEYELYEDLFLWISDQLERNSPVGRSTDKRPGHPGLYRASNILLLDGEIADPATAVSFKDEAVFAPTTPYARKIERGLSNQAPDGVYQVVATLAQNRFGNLARIRFGYRSLLTGGIHEWALTTKMPSKSRGARREDWLRRQPAIVVTHR